MSGSPLAQVITCQQLSGYLLPRRVRVRKLYLTSDSVISTTLALTWNERSRRQEYRLAVKQSHRNQMNSWIKTKCFFKHIYWKMSLWQTVFHCDNSANKKLPLFTVYLSGYRVACLVRIKVLTEENTECQPFQISPIFVTQTPFKLWTYTKYWCISWSYISNDISDIN